MSAYHLLVWDTDDLTDDDLDAFRDATANSRDQFRALWAQHDCSALMPMDSPATDADTVLDEAMDFLRHSVLRGGDIRPIVLETGEMVMLKLMTVGRPVLAFPGRLDQSHPLPFTHVAAILFSAAIIHRADRQPSTRQHGCDRLNDLFGESRPAIMEEMRTVLLDWFLGLPSQKKAEAS